MTSHFALPGDATKRLDLKKALLLYTNSQGDALATVHDIHKPEEGPSLLPGTPLDRNALADLVAKLSGQSQRRTILAERTLFADASMLVWWCPSARRKLYFKSGKADLDELSGKEALHPPLVFLARSQHLSVWALAGNARPLATTKLYTAPYFNLYAGGNMCIGNVRLPESLDPSEPTLVQWEEAFFGTNFTHSNLGSGKLTSFPGGHNALWKAMVSGGYDRFPHSSLIPLPSKLTLEEAINQGVKL